MRRRAVVIEDDVLARGIIKETLDGVDEVKIAFTEPESALHVSATHGER